MATFTQAQLCAVTELTTSAATLYTVPASKSVIIKSILVANKSASDTTYTIYYVPSGGSAGTSNLVFGSIPISANSTQTIEVTSVLPTGATIMALAAANSAVNVHISGVEVA